MLFKQYESEGLSHYSYLIADLTQAVVIDPRRDIDIYIKDCVEGGYHINVVLETHRNEDYLIGSCELEHATGAAVFHADQQWDYRYGSPTQNGQIWKTGRLKIKAIHTPGHTPGSMSYILYDPDGNPWMVFTGDCLFSGDVGRVDLLGEEKMEELASQMYDSIFKKILPLGDSVLVCPAHGAGSVCGSEIAERTITSIGLERQHNPKLQVSSRKEFIERHAKILERPPYFRKMEELNLAGPQLLKTLPIPKPLPPAAFKDASESAQLIDTRPQVAFGAAHVPGSVSLWNEVIPNFSGWFLAYDKPILLVCDYENIESNVRKLIRMGFDKIGGYLDGGVVGWAKFGGSLDTIRPIAVEALNEILKSGQPFFLIDVRAEKEVKEAGLKHAAHIHLTNLMDHLETIPKDQLVITICPSGNRAMVAASLLQKEGWKDLAVPVGGIGAWNACDCDFDL
jgi:hydroxyacylglutathione hydrolase